MFAALSFFTTVFLALWLLNLLLVDSKGVFLMMFFYHMVDAVNAKSLLLVLNISFGIFNHGKVNRIFVW